MNIAIRGHATRGEEVIEILESMGGKNTFGLSGDASDLYYFIDNNNKISYTYTSSTLYKFTDFKIFTVDEFYKKQKTMEIKPNLIKNKNAFIDIANAEYSDVNTIELLCSDMFDIEIIHEDKIVLRRKKPQYPKTYDECVGMFNDTIKTVNLTTFAALRKLIYCRNAYWKIAGEQMGLGKPWEPEYPSEHYIFTIENQVNNIIKNAICDRWRNRLLIFPTKEMRDEFYENFKELIEICKDFL